jgi:ribonuclease-3
MNTQSLIRKIGYTFKEPKLLQQALTHRSHDSADNERLEFLGDSILNFIITEELYKRFPHLSEGELSRFRAGLVKGETLAVIAQDLGLGDYLQLGGGELKSGGFRRPSILADSLEAIIAAIYLDSSIQSCQVFILTHFATKIDSINVDAKKKDPKTALQEYLQSRKMPLPVYTLLSTTGEDHEQCFEIECLVEKIDYKTKASAESRRKAEQRAAEQFLLRLQRK